MIFVTAALDQIVESSEEIIDGEMVEIDAGHVDFGPKWVDGEAILALRDDRANPPVWRHPGDVVIRVTDSALMKLPADGTYDFVAAEPDSQVFVIPQTQSPDVVWLGWNTQDPAVIERAGRGVTMSLTAYAGTGETTLFLQDGAFGKPTSLWNTSAPGVQDIFAEPNTHVHANWVFSDPGEYALGVRAEFNDISTDGVLRFAVGGDADAGAAAELTPTPLTPAADAGGSGSVERSVDSDSDGANVTLVVGAVGGAAALVAFGVFLWRRQHRTRALMAKELS